MLRAMQDCPRHTEPTYKLFLKLSTFEQSNQAKVISRGTCASSESPTWTTTNCACSTTFRGTCGGSAHTSVISET